MTSAPLMDRRLRLIVWCFITVMLTGCGADDPVESLIAGSDTFTPDVIEGFDGSGADAAGDTSEAPTGDADITPDVSPDAAPDASFDTTPDASFDTTPDASFDATPDAPDVPPDIDVGPPPPDPNEGWIGAACEDTAACDYDGPICIDASQGYPWGMCSQACDRYCPDQADHAGTFCRDTQWGGRCIARCDYSAYPNTGGCREGYRCKVIPRYNEPSVTAATCLPEGDPLFDTLDPVEQELDALGIVWGGWDYTTRSPSTHPNLDCTIDHPVRVSSPINGVDYLYYNADAPTPMSMGAELAFSLHRLSEVLKEYNIVQVLHIGTFNCRVISGTSTLSQHSFGEAIDIYGFVDDQGRRLILEEDWEHDTTTPMNYEAQVLYEISQRMYDDFIFNIILTPNYNAGHDNHFHVDLTDGSHYLGAVTPDMLHHIGPNHGH